METTETDGKRSLQVFSGGGRAKLYIFLHLEEEAEDAATTTTTHVSRTTTIIIQSMAQNAATKCGRSRRCYAALAIGIVVGDKGSIVVRTEREKADSNCICQIHSICLVSSGSRSSYCRAR